MVSLAILLAAGSFTQGMGILAGIINVIGYVAADCCLPASPVRRREQISSD
jgi:hypothetical protein